MRVIKILIFFYSSLFFSLVTVFGGGLGQLAVVFAKMTLIMIWTKARCKYGYHTYHNEGRAEFVYQNIIWGRAGCYNKFGWA